MANDDLTNPDVVKALLESDPTLSRRWCQLCRNFSKTGDLCAGPAAIDRYLSEPQFHAVAYQLAGMIEQLPGLNDQDIMDAAVVACELRRQKAQRRVIDTMVRGAALLLAVLLPVVACAQPPTAPTRVCIGDHPCDSVVVTKPAPLPHAGLLIAGDSIPYGCVPAPGYAPANLAVWQPGGWNQHPIEPFQIGPVAWVNQTFPGVCNSGAWGILAGLLGVDTTLSGWAVPGSTLGNFLPGSDHRNSYMVANSGMGSEATTLVAWWGANDALNQADTDAFQARLVEFVTTAMAANAYLTRVLIPSNLDPPSPDIRDRARFLSIDVSKRLAVTQLRQQGIDAVLVDMKGIPLAPYPADVHPADYGPVASRLLPFVSIR